MIQVEQVNRKDTKTLREKYLGAFVTWWSFLTRADWGIALLLFAASF
jgi:hypothetical protein